MKHSYVEKWASDKPLLVALVAIEAVSSADELATVVTNAAEGGRYGLQEEAVDLGKWIRLYRGHRRLQRFVLDEIVASLAGLGDEGALSEIVEVLQSSVREKARMEPIELQKEVEEFARNDPEGLQEAVRLGQETARDLFAADDVLDCGGATDDGEWTALLAREETLFFMLVWVPCLLEYGEYPARLMRRARQGEPDALDKLLRLDKRAISDKKIGQEWARASTKRNGSFELMWKALHDPPKEMGAGKVKMVLAGLISACSKFIAEQLKKGSAESGIPVPAALLPLTKRLNGPAIRDLFDAYHKDVTGDRMAQDDDIPKDNEALKKALQRRQKLWDFLWECI
jgi:hypothetical protein